jgi:hypothetical protein
MLKRKLQYFFQIIPIKQLRLIGITTPSQNQTAVNLTKLAAVEENRVIRGPQIGVPVDRAEVLPSPQVPRLQLGSLRP